MLGGNPGYEDGDDDELPDDSYEAMQARRGGARLGGVAGLLLLCAVGVAWGERLW